MAGRSVLCCEELISFTAGGFALKQTFDAASSGEYNMPRPHSESWSELQGHIKLHQRALLI